MIKLRLSWQAFALKYYLGNAIPTPWSPYVGSPHPLQRLYLLLYLVAITRRSPYRDGRMCRGTWSARKTPAWSYEAWVYNFRPPPRIRTQRTNKARVRLVLVPHLAVEERCAFTYMVGFSQSLIDKHSWNNVERVRERGVGKCWSWYWLSGRVVCCPSVSADGSFYHSYSHDQLASIIASLCPQILSRQCHINSMIPMCW